MPTDTAPLTQYSPAQLRKSARRSYDRPFCARGACSHLCAPCSQGLPCASVGPTPAPTQRVVYSTATHKLLRCCTAWVHNRDVCRARMVSPTHNLQRSTQVFYCQQPQQEQLCALSRDRTVRGIAQPFHHHDAISSNTDASLPQSMGSLVLAMESLTDRKMTLIGNGTTRTSQQQHKPVRNRPAAAVAHKHT